MPVKVLTPVDTGPRNWFEAEAGFYAFFRNVTIVPATAPPSSLIKEPTSPGFAGLLSTSSAITPNTTPIGYGGGVNFAWGHWLNPQQTTAIDGSFFFGMGYEKAPLRPTNTTTDYIGTTPAVFVHTFTDTTTIANSGIWDAVYGADVNYRTTVPNFPYVTNFEVMVGLRYVGLDDITSSSTSTSTTNYDSALGLPVPARLPIIDSSGPSWYGIWNNFIGPKIGFNLEEHWGPWWVKTEDKVAVGANIELVTSGPTVFSTQPVTGLHLAGIPLVVNSGAPLVTGTSGGSVRVKGAFAFVPSGTIKIGYDIIPDQRSLTLAYQYLYMSDVGLIADQFPLAVGVRQSSFFAQGVTLGFKEKF
jgi:Putative beta barrel porin-7 (BBP7)